MPASAAAIAISQVYLQEAFANVEAAAKKVLADVAEGDMLRTQMTILRRLVKFDPLNGIAAREKIAAEARHLHGHVKSAVGRGALQDGVTQRDLGTAAECASEFHHAGRTCASRSSRKPRASSFNPARRASETVRCARRS